MKEDKATYTTILIVVVVIVFSVISFPVFYAIIQHRNYVIPKDNHTMIVRNKVSIIVPDSIAQRGDQAVNIFVLQAISVEE